MRFGSPPVTDARACRRRASSTAIASRSCAVCECQGEISGNAGVRGLECSGGVRCEATLVIVESAALLAFAATAAEAFEVVIAPVVLQSG